MRSGRPIAFTLAGGIALTSLAACQPREQQDEPVIAQAEEEPEAAAGAGGVSIIRPELDPESEAPPLAALETTISFADGEELDAAARADLETVIRSPQVKAGGPIVLRGHTDAVGSDRANERASRRRAEIVRDYLIENGIDEERIRVIAMGEMRPIAPNAKLDGSPDEAGRAANRRVDITVDVEEVQARATPGAAPIGDSRSLVEQAVDASR